MSFNFHRSVFSKSFFPEEENVTYLVRQESGQQSLCAPETAAPLRWLRWVLLLWPTGARVGLRGRAETAAARRGLLATSRASEDAARGSAGPRPTGTFFFPFLAFFLLFNLKPFGSIYIVYQLLTGDLRLKTQLLGTTRWRRSCSCRGGGSGGRVVAAKARGGQYSGACASG